MTLGFGGEWWVVGMGCGFAYYDQPKSLVGCVKSVDMRLR